MILIGFIAKIRSHLDEHACGLIRQMIEIRFIGIPYGSYNLFFLISAKITRKHISLPLLLDQSFNCYMKKHKNFLVSLFNREQVIIFFFDFGRNDESISTLCPFVFV